MFVKLRDVQTQVTKGKWIKQNFTHSSEDNQKLPAQTPIPEPCLLF